MEIIGKSECIITLLRHYFIYGQLFFNHVILIFDIVDCINNHTDLLPLYYAYLHLVQLNDFSRIIFQIFNV